MVTYFCFQQIYAIQRDYLSACHYLQIGADFAGSAHSEYTRLLFILSKGMVGIRSLKDFYNMCIEIYILSFNGKNQFNLIHYFKVEITKKKKTLHIYIYSIQIPVTNKSSKDCMDSSTAAAYCQENYRSSRNTQCCWPVY